VGKRIVALMCVAEANPGGFMSKEKLVKTQYSQINVKLDIKLMIIVQCRVKCHGQRQICAVMN
jgi:hypothetical protein